MLTQRLEGLRRSAGAVSLEENCAAAELELSEQDLAELDAMPPAAGDRY
jgi:hypothetical protein